MREIHSDCPDYLRPTYHTQDKVFTYPHGAEIHISGANNGHAENLRGHASGLAIVDEAGFVDELEYLVQDILTPQLLTTGGKLLISSTPSRTPAHEYKGFVEQAEKDGCYSEFNIYQAGYAQELVEKFKKEAGGENSTTWKREYMCKFVVDEDFAIVPEWGDQFVKATEKNDFYPFWIKHDAMDIGFKDKTVVLFGFYDFLEGKAHIEDEIVMHGPAMTTDRLCDAIKAKEKELWGEGAKVHRVADNNNLILLQDMGQLHKLDFLPTTKDKLEAMVNQLRFFVKSGRVIVDPKCTETIGCLKYGVWDEARRQFDRSKSYGHYDALAALVYFIRNLDTNTNPIPENFGLRNETHFFHKKENTESRALKEAFGVPTWITR